MWQRMVVGLLLLAGSGVACVHEPAALPVTRNLPFEPPRPRHWVAAHRAAATRALPRTPAVNPAPYERAWHPRGRKISSRWTTIVIHHSGTERGNAALFDRGHRRRGWDELGYHFVIGNGTNSGDGVVEVGSRWHQQKHGAHCKTPGNYYNDHGIGICLVGDFTRDRPTRAQMASLMQLLRFLCSECGISPSRVTGHCQITRKTACPGKNFPLAWVQSRLGAPVTASSLP